MFDTITSTLVQITDSDMSSSNVSINADGTRIAFQSSADPLNRNADASLEIFHFDTVTCALSQVTAGHGGDHSRAPSINADGTRIAFHSDGNPLGTNPTANTEVFLAEIGEASQLDFGDAPAPYPTLCADDGARHLIVDGGPFLGSEPPDGESDGQPDPTAGQSATGGDDNTGAADEDGVRLSSSMVASNTAATTASFEVAVSQAGYLDAWIDFNQDGDWDDTGEQIFTSENVASGMNLLSFTVPAEAKAGETGARWRLSSTGGLAPTGGAPDGEVEDYIALILDGDGAGGAAVNIDPTVSGTLDVLTDGNNLVVRSGAIDLFRAPVALLNRVEVFGTEGDDTLNVANLDAIFAGLVAGDAGAGNDTLGLTGGGQDLDLTQIADADIQGIEEIDITGTGDNVLALNVDEVLNISPTTDILRVRHDDGDTTNYGDGWTVEIPQIIDGQFIHILVQDSATVQVVNTLPFQNPLRPLDTNRDSKVSPLDALIIINRLNETGSEELLTPTSVAGLIEFFYCDNNDDGWIAPIDLLQIVNFLNDPTSNSEGEFSVPHVDFDLADTPLRVSAISAKDQDDNTSALHRSAVIAVEPVAARTVSRHETPRRFGALTSGAEDEDLVGAVDAFFEDFQFLIRGSLA